MFNLSAELGEHMGSTCGCNMNFSQFEMLKQMFYMHLWLNPCKTANPALIINWKTSNILKYLDSTFWHWCASNELKSERKSYFAHFSMPLHVLPIKLRDKACTIQYTVNLFSRHAFLNILNLHFQKYLAICKPKCMLKIWNPMKD